MKRILSAIILALLAVPAYAQQWDQVNGSMQVKSGPTAPLVIIDQTASGQKILSLRANGTEVCSSTATAFTCSGGFTLSSGQLLLPDGTAAAPALAWSAEPTSGWYRNAAGDLRLSILGTGRYAFQAASFYMLNDSAAMFLGSSSDVSLSRGAADRLDLATGDSFKIVSGGLGVGVTATTAGRIESSGDIFSGSDLRVLSTGQMYWQSRSSMTSAASGKWSATTSDLSTGIYSLQFTDNPTCATNCGTSPTLSGVDSSFTLTMGATGTPASGFVVTFNGTWAAAPQCTGAMALAGMANTKLPLTLVTTTTTLTVATNGANPANGDKYHFMCSLGQ